MMTPWPKSPALDDPEIRHRVVNELLQSDGWFVLCESIDKKIEHAMKELLNPGTDQNRVNFLRGEISIFNTILQEPGTIVEQAMFEAEDDRRLAEKEPKRLRPVPRGL